MASPYPCRPTRRLGVFHRRLAAVRKVCSEEQVQPDERFALLYAAIKPSDHKYWVPKYTLRGVTDA